MCSLVNAGNAQLQLQLMPVLQGPRANAPMLLSTSLASPAQRRHRLACLQGDDTARLTAHSEGSDASVYMQQLHAQETRGCRLWRASPFCRVQRY